MVSSQFFKQRIIMVVLENALKKSRITSSERIISIAQLEELEVDEMDEDQLQDMAETFFDESTFKIFILD